MKKLLFTTFATALLTGCGGAARPGVGQQNAGETPRTRHPSASATDAGGNTLKAHRPGTGTASAGG